MNFLKIPLHKTSTAYQNGLLDIFEHGLTAIQTCMVHVSYNKSDFLKILNTCVHRFEKNSTDNEYNLGMYAASGWFQHALHGIDIIEDVSELMYQLREVIKELQDNLRLH